METAIHHWWYNQDDYQHFFFWMERAYQGSLELWMKVHFNYNVLREDHYQSPTTKGIPSTWQCAGPHGKNRWTMKADPVGHGVIVDSKDTDYEATTHGIYIDARPHMEPVSQSSDFTWFANNPEQLGLFGVRQDVSDELAYGMDFGDTLRIQLADCPFIDLLCDMTIFHLTGRVKTLDVNDICTATVAYVIDLL